MRTYQRDFALALILSSGSYHVTQVRSERLGPGDLIFYDSRYQLDVDIVTSWSSVVLRLSEQFVRNWLPNPIVLAERRLGDSRWGRVLASYVAQLSPEFVVHAPLAQAVLMNRSTRASRLDRERAKRKPHRINTSRTLGARPRVQSRGSCADTSLQTADIASSLNISTRTLHRVLGACGDTFGAMLIQARVDLAVRMLQSPLFDRVTTGEIGRFAGFSDASHFVKALRRRTGQTPLQMRRASHGRLIAPSAPSAH